MIYLVVLTKNKNKSPNFNHLVLNCYPCWSDISDRIWVVIVEEDLREDLEYPFQLQS